MLLSSEYSKPSLKVINIEKISLPATSSHIEMLMMSSIPVIKDLSLLSEDSRKNFLYQHPILVSKNKANNFILVGNFRSLEVAKSLEEKRVPCIVIEHIPQHDQVNLIATNELINILFFSLENSISSQRALQLREALLNTDEKILIKICKKFESKKGFCEITQINPRTKM